MLSRLIPRALKAAATEPEARDRLAMLEAQLKAEQARAQGLEEALAAAEAELAELSENYRSVRKHLRWQWATYPGTKKQRLSSEREDPFAERTLALRSRLVELLAAPEFPHDDWRVTAVVTSCARYDLLTQSLLSFFATNTHPDLRMIVVEDGEADPPDEVKAAFAGRPISWINTGGRLGQIRAIDLAYGRVETPYIFHMEDDFRFLRPGYVEKSIAILECEPLCLQVWAKRHSSPDGHGPADGLRTSQGVSWRPVAKDFKAVWHGFSFNPNLRRLRDYRLVGSYAEVAESERGSADVA